MDDSAVHQALDRSAALGTFVSLLAGGAADVCTSLAAVLGDPDLRIAYEDMPGAGTAVRARVPGREL